ncbi:RTX toxins and related Ca2+-binding protein [Hahella chejuensis KCTC 2396]|uniref:RTX toxins and related Ca2+-binding protein n=1 Tax=Hahella chejuensis (strain KCTC 2396) TaxID=349521 RepID=Q2SJA2_HAHCH|nr:glycoside hydrolase family 48 protein [Hahella chejuensis]ABC29272.1 RTX toxins and related Ca2+-binding protein [Hahella chejuensis KCTC 2396]
MDLTFKKRPLKGMLLPIAAAVSFATFCSHAQASAEEYNERFMEMWNKIHDPANGYFSADGGPYHSVETLIVEAPDHGHESTSEAYSYFLLLEAYYGKVTGDWSKLRNAWAKMEEHIIPTQEMQPTNNFYNPSKPASYAAEHAQPSGYPSQLEFGVPVGEDPISAKLAQTYGSWDVYGMHWLLDMDNIYGYGNLGDGVSTPSYINTFQRGEQESVWETVTHPSWESFKWGGPNGFLPLFTKDNNYSRQWRYTNAPDADARAVQVMYWAYQWIKEQGKDPEQEVPGLMAKAAKMGDYLRLAMFDKYFKKMGTQDKNAQGGKGYESAHYLMSWYYAWGGAADANAGWAFRIGSSHVHFGYQNPIAAMALSEFDPLKPRTPGATEDWATGLKRSMEFYTWLQSAEGGIAGGATNSWDGSYKPHPQDRADATFYGMVYDENPVYHDPGSGTWFGWQAWSMQRVAEYYYLKGDAQAKQLMDKWAPWVLSNINWLEDGSFEIPATLEWTGKPEKWDPANPKANTNLHVSVVDHGQDLGIAAGVAKALMFYAAAAEKYDTPQNEAKEASKKLLDAMWTHFKTPKGLAAPEKRGDYARFFDKVYVPGEFNGSMANGDAINSESTFLSMRSFYLDDPMFKQVEDALNSGEDPVFTYHRFWAQTEAATAYANYAALFEGDNPCDEGCAPTAQPLSVSTRVNKAVSITLKGTDSDGTVVGYTVSKPPQHGTLSGSGANLTYQPEAGFSGQDAFEYTVTDNSGEVSAPAKVSIDVAEASISLTSPADGAEFETGATITVKVNKEAGLQAQVILNGAVAATIAGDSDAAQVTLPTSEGSHSLLAKLLDEDGAVIATSNSISVKTKKAPSGDGLTCTVREDVWNSGFVAHITLTNNTNAVIDGWTVNIPLGATDQYTNGWSAQYSANGSVLKASNMSWNATLQPGASTSIGFQGTHGGDHAPIKCTE